MTRYHTKLFVGMTGASGVLFGLHFIRRWCPPSIKMDVSISEGSFRVLTCEHKTHTRDQYSKHLAECKNVNVHHNNDLGAKPASGSYGINAAVILPCSMNTLAKIAVGISDSLITRAVDVCLKESKKVILCTRETPLNIGHIENMLRAARKGCTIMPIQHAFYTDKNFFAATPLEGPDAIAYEEHQIRNFCGRILDQLGIDNSLVKRW